MACRCSQRRSRHIGVVREIGAGCVVDAAPASIAVGLEAMLADSGRSRAMGELLGRAHVAAHYGWSASPVA